MRIRVWGDALARKLKERATVITCGITDAVDVRADLSTIEGRKTLIDEVQRRSGGCIDGVALVAGIDSASALTVRLNYFGTVEVLKGLRPLLAASNAPSAVVVTSSSTLNKGSHRLVNACLSGNEEKAVRIADQLTRLGLGSLFATSLSRPLGSPGPVASVVGLIAFLLSDENRFTTGQVVFADGGTDALRRSDKPLEIDLKYSWREMLQLIRITRKTKK